MLALTGCAPPAGTPTPRDGGTIVVALPGRAVSLNPLVARDSASLRAYTPLFPLLFAAQPDLSVGPSLAAALPVYSDGGLTLTVSLRQDALWSDGTAITADDVVYTVTTEMNPRLQTGAAFDWTSLRSVTRIDAHTVRFTLRAPDAAFLADSLVTPIVPQHALASVDPARMADAAFSSAPAVSGGPFVFDHRGADGSVLLDANPRYFLGRPHADHLLEQVVAVGASVSTQLGEGQLSWDPELSPAAAGDAVISSGVTVSSYPEPAVVGVQFNVRAGHVFAAAAVRQAFALSVDHDAIVAEATGASQAYPVWSDVSPASWASTAVTHYGRDPNRARQLLQGLAASGSLVFPRDDAQRAEAAALLAQQSSAAGFALRPVGLDPAGFAAALRGGSFDAALVALSIGVDPDDSTLLATGGAENAGGYSSAALDSLFRSDLAATTGPGSTLQQQRKPILAHIEQMVSRELPVYFLWAPRHDMGFSATLGGVTAVGAQLDADRSNAFYLDWFLTG